MLAVKPDFALDRQDYRSIAAAVRMELGEITAALTTNFDTASLALGDAVTVIDQIVTALQDMASIFDKGEAATAVGNLMEAAENLRTVTAHADTRANTVAEIRTSSAALRTCAGDILRCIQILDIYGMNVKINSSGSEEFMDFADRMRCKLSAASGEVRSLDKTLLLLESSLCEITRNDALLVEESAKVVPQVPDRLMRDARALEQHQAGLVRLAQAINEVAKATRDELGLAISAIQVGDRVRQRLEHVVFGCQLVDDIAASDNEDMARAEALQRHFLPLLGALTRAAATEFGDDAEALVASLIRLKETSLKLTTLQGPDRNNEGQGFLELLKCGITEANGMIAQLSQADRQGVATREQVLATVDDVAAKMAAITELRLEVRNMAINIGLRCRNVGEVGKPIAVVANEIRSYSDRLDLIVSAISVAEASLLHGSSRISGTSAEGSTSACQLSGFLDVIGECDSRSAVSLEFVHNNASKVQSALDRAIADLQPFMSNAERVYELALSLDVFKVVEISNSDELSDALQDVYDTLYKKYTMNAEREIHKAFLNSIGVCFNCREGITSDQDNDEDFDDGLF